MNLKNLETPCLILDKTILENNLEFLRKRLLSLGVPLRPHGKTAKNIDVIQMALKGESVGLTVSTLKEAEYYFDHGIRDLLYAVGIAPVKLDRLMALTKRGAELKLILDSMAQAVSVAERAQEEVTEIPILLEVDCDGHRSGLTPENPQFLEIGMFLSREPGVRLDGVLTHAGSSYGCRSTDEIRTVAQAERDFAVHCAQQLRNSGLTCPTVSIGSTPTATFAENLSGVTEVRAGVYMFQDLVMAGLGVCRVDDIALSVLTSVIGHQKQKGWVITDAGWMALSRDRGTAHQEVDGGYGWVCDVQGRVLEDYLVSATNQEHGIITHRYGQEIDWERFAIGNPLRILPNHACATAAKHDQYQVVEGNTEVSARWDRINGW